MANTVEDFESAASKGDQDQICRELLAKPLVATYAERGGTCEHAVDGALKDTDSFGLTVESVRIAGTRGDRAREGRPRQERRARAPSTWSRRAGLADQRVRDGLAGVRSVALAAPRGANSSIEGRSGLRPVARALSAGQAGGTSTSVSPSGRGWTDVDLVAIPGAHSLPR